MAYKNKNNDNTVIIMSYTAAVFQAATCTLYRVVPV